MESGTERQPPASSPASESQAAAKPDAAAKPESGKAEATSLLVGPERANQMLVTSGFQNLGGRAIAMTAYLFLFGALYDLIMLWWVQRQPAPESEFSALVTTVEGLPRVVLAIALLYVARYLRGSTSLIGYRLLALMLLAVGVAGAAAAGLMATDYFILRGTVSPEAASLFRSTAFKTVLMGALHTILLVPLGIVGFRRP